MDFPPILIFLVIWLILGPILSAAGKKQRQQQAAQQKADKVRKAHQQAQAPSAPAAVSAPIEPVRPTVLEPTITFTEHDDSVYQGSMDAVTGEGYDPCHDEQLAPLNAVEAAVPAAETAVPGLQLNWSGGEIVRGLVMSEILKRK